MPDSLASLLRTATEDRFVKDWARQRRTATDVLRRLKSQEGVVLADQVGMGKTYVALAVAVSEILSTPELGQVVVFVPAAVADKWVREWRKFSKSLLKPGAGIRCVDKPVRSGEELLRKLDDTADDREHIIIVTHTALTTTLKDTFIQLALLYYATRSVKDGGDLRKRIAKWSTGMNGLIRNLRFTSERVTKLLDTPPSNWQQTWLRLTGEVLPDSPVPKALQDAAGKLRLEELRNVINALPVRRSPDVARRLETARKAIAEATQASWKWMLSNIELDLSLLIVDEAHRLKNPRTQISSLFGDRVKDTGAGAFNGIFRRMLFLTATPFELGHSELIEVLSRMGAVRGLTPAPSSSLKERLEKLAQVLAEAQVTALSLDDAWGRVLPADHAAFDNWGCAAPPADWISPAGREAWQRAKSAVHARRRMHLLLRPWVIRHERHQRRDYHPGIAISADDGAAVGGLLIPNDAALPFLLCARVQSIALDEKGGRPLFAYGIASSYEAFRRLGLGQDVEALDSDRSEEDREQDGAITAAPLGALDAVGWYRNEIDRALGDPNVRDAHPKVRATVEKAAQLWLKGEKCLIFCWFIKTGEAVERALAKRIDSLIFDQASEALGTESVEETRLTLDRISDRLFRRGGQSYERIRQLLVISLTEPSGGHQDVIDLVVDAAIRHLRTPGYLVRYATLSVDITDEEVWAGINGANRDRIVFLDRLRRFAELLAKGRNQVVEASQDQDSEFSRVDAALLGQGSEDDQAVRRGASLHPVRRAHGGTERDVRERLITLFNTPLSPDLLVASSVMGEGIDLHQECRFIIHHDLDWNPSVLEQRTGRLDRIGALAEREGKNIQVFEPYLGGTHDEKMFRVVKDRSQWFDIVMGRPTGVDEHATDAEENRLPLHQSICEALAMDLRSPGNQ